MTHLCYTLEEAAEKLKLSETVLVRLSQYFKVPRTAYEDVGYLSFKGDLAFTEQDLAFFRQAKERLLSGQSLDEVKSRMREEPGIPAGQGSQGQWREILKDSATAQPASASAYGAYRMPEREEVSQPNLMNPSMQQHHPNWAGVEPAPQPQKPDHRSAVQGGIFNPLLGTAQRAAQSDVPNEEAGPIREIQDRKPYEKAAEQSFERYKSIHRAGLGRVFENIMKEVGSSGSRKQKSSGLAGLRGKNGYVSEPLNRPTAAKTDAFLPFMRGLGNLVSAKPDPKGNMGWEQVIHQAVSQPRTLNTQLKSAAALLRERALEERAINGQPHQEKRR